MSSSVDGADRASFDALAARAQAERDPEAALLAWEDVRTRFPGDPLAYAESIRTLDRLKRRAEADELAAEALEKFPNSARIAVEHGWLAHHRADWPEADRRWRGMRERFPETLEGYFGGAATLRALNRFAEAEALYAHAVPRWPQHQPLFAAFAACAEQAGDFSTALLRYRQLGELDQGDPAGLLGEARALMALEQTAAAGERYAEALHRFPKDPATVLQCARFVQGRGDAAKTLEYWKLAAEILPGSAEAYLGMARALNDLSRYAEAEAAVERARALAPDFAVPAWLHAQIAHNRGDFATALARWTAVRAQFPGHSSGYTSGMWSLLALARQAEAAALMEEAVARFPADQIVALDWARIPHHVQDWPEAQRRWTDLQAQFPGQAAVLAGLADVLARQGKWEEAEALLAETAARGDDFEILCAWAECASHRRDWPEAETRWRRATAQFPDNPWGWTRLGEMLRDAGRFDDFDGVLAGAIARFGKLREIKLQMALTQTFRRNWPEAMRLLAELKREHPRSNEVRAGITYALEQARLDLGAAAAEGKIPFVIPAILEEPTDGRSVRDLFLKFEALGGTCEFGMAQRRYGAEPISLMRWASTDPPELITALETDFAGVGELEHTVIEISNEEYATRDDRYFMFTHTFIRTTTAPLDEFTVQHLKRMQFMRRKLLHDLATSTKIFVCTGDFGENNVDARKLFTAIRRYGSSTGLFCVSLAGADHPAGTVERCGHGFYMGYIDRFSTKDVNYLAWPELCRKADEFWTGESAP